MGALTARKNIMHLLFTGAFLYVRHSFLLTFNKFCDLKVVTNEKGEALADVLTITYMLVGEVVLDVFL